MVRKHGRLKFSIFWCGVLVPLVVSVELLSWLLIVNGVPSRIWARHRASVGLHIASQERLPLLKPEVMQAGWNGIGPSSGEDPRLIMFHPMLGWDYPPGVIYRGTDGITYTHDAEGARRTCTTFSDTAIVTYGDSFTYCANVGDDQTWQTFTARKIEANVLNYGVNGYGTDQAVLKYVLYGQHTAKIVILGILPENINRIVNIYRPFYVPGEATGVTKPMFLQEGAGFVVMANPLQEVEDISKLQDPAFLQKLGTMDYWYQLDEQLPELTFPWVVSLYRWRAPVYTQFALSARRVLRLPNRVRYPWNLYDDPRAFAVMRYIVDLFVTTARCRDAIPIVAIMPRWDYVMEIMDNGVSRYEPLMAYMKAQGYHFIDVVQAMADMHPTRTQLENWYSGHATAEGNKVVAGIISRHLKDHYSSLLDGHDDSPMPNASPSGKLDCLEAVAKPSVMVTARYRE